jgi:hypothetical protein
VALLIPAACLAQSYDRPAWYLTFYGGSSARILGTQDIRTNYGVGISYSRPERHFKWRHGPANLVLEGYYEHSIGEPAEGRSSTFTESVGFIGYARFRFIKRDYALYFDIGEGINFSNLESPDLDTKINSSPMIGGGVAIRQGSRETLLGVRILHLSNAGLRGSNRGQNQILFTVSVRF